MNTTEEKMRALGRMIEKARRSKKLQSKQLAEFAGVSSSELNRVESGEIWPTDDAWEKICGFIGLPIGMLAQAKRPSVPRPEAATSENKNEERKVPANVIVLAEHKMTKWRQTSLFEKD